MHHFFEILKSAAVVHGDFLIGPGGQFDYEIDFWDD